MRWESQLWTFKFHNYYGIGECIIIVCDWIRFSLSVEFCNVNQLHESYIFVAPSCKRWDDESINIWKPQQLVTANQTTTGYYICATWKLYNNEQLTNVVLFSLQASHFTRIFSFHESVYVPFSFHGRNDHFCTPQDTIMCQDKTYPSEAGCGSNFERVKSHH